MLCSIWISAQEGASRHSLESQSVISGILGYSESCPSQGNIYGSADESRGFCAIFAETEALSFKARNDDAEFCHGHSARCVITEYTVTKVIVITF